MCLGVYRLFIEDDITNIKYKNLKKSLVGARQQQPTVAKVDEIKKVNKKQ